MPGESKPTIFCVRYGEEEEGNSRLEFPSAYAIIEWPDGTETCAWRSDNIRHRGTTERNQRGKAVDRMPSEDAHEPLISDEDCSKCREGHGDGTCAFGFKSGYNEKGEIECQNFNPKMVDREPIGKMDGRSKEVITIPCFCGRHHVVVVRWDRPMITISSNIFQHGQSKLMTDEHR